MPFPGMNGLRIVRTEPNARTASSYRPDCNKAVPSLFTTAARRAIDDDVDAVIQSMFPIATVLLVDDEAVAAVAAVVVQC